MHDTPIDEQVDTTTDADMVDDAVPEDAEAAPEQAEAATGPRLVLKRSGQETDVSFEFTPPATIGRFDPEVGPVDIDLGKIEEGSFVSRKHAKIVMEDDRYKIVDLGSSNGTYVLRSDFEKVDEAELNDGDEIALGNARFVFHT
jgi:pSer/pThr/pTyr-binding forkhead associated (FHA) protein